MKGFQVSKNERGSGSSSSGARITECSAKIHTLEERTGPKNMVEGDLKCDAKIDLLAQEGVPFDRRGYLKSREYLWDGKA